MKDRSPPAPLMNLLDKAISYFNPREAARRMHARQVMALAGGYNGARRDRAATGAWQTSAGSPDTDVIADLPTLRARSRDLERNAPIAGTVIATTVAYAAGTGLTCNPQIDAEALGISEERAAEWQKDVRRRFKAYYESPDVDLARVLNGYGLQRQALRTVLASGDAFAITPIVTRAGREPRVAIQLLEADRVSNPLGKRDSDTFTDGIEHDPATGEAIAYHVCNRHPGDLRGSQKTWERIEARGATTGRRNVLHLFDQLRPGLRRGVPIIAPLIEPLKQISDYTNAELAAAVANAVNAVFIEMDGDAFKELYDGEGEADKLIDQRSSWSGEISSGRAINLLPGEKPHNFTPGRPNPQFADFVTAITRQIGMRTGIPYEVLVMHYQSSYTAARGALLQAWKFFLAWRDWLVTTFCQPHYDLWLADEVAAGRIAAPGFFADEVVRAAWCAAQWVGDGPGTLDEQKAAAAAHERLDIGISTLQAESIAHDGVDWETKHRQQAKERQARQQDGLGAAAAAPPTAQPGKPPQPKPGKPEDANDDDTDDETTGAPAS